MNDLLTTSTFFGMMITITTYEIGNWIKKKWNFALFNPMLISIVLIIAFLLVFDVDYQTYYSGAQFLSYLLTPATVCLAVPLYEQWELMKRYKWAILAGIVAGVIASAACVLVFAMLFHFTHEQYVTLLPKSITTAIGMGVSEELGGMVTITVAVIVVTGILGNVIAENVCKWFHIEEPVAKGIAIGTSSHAMGTAKAMELGEIEGAVSSLSIAVAGILTVIAASVFACFW